ncbi:hypothetical protein V6B08_15370 [Ferrovibrio sp. MS7]|uniref:hypothetical protein n=1 Tax=Ferrovibrio plantarum TaxID=3119164 RepID=UPI00313530FA
MTTQFSHPPAPSALGRYIALFQGKQTELFVLAFDGTRAEADELGDRLDRACKLGLLLTGLVIAPNSPILELGAENIHLALDQLFNDFPPREAPPETTPPPPPTNGRATP